ncbi:MAG: DegT/DnrJ/EryC1/StrS family aminotransferase [bacterium]|nr:DegT/DnrJ/EryC1/StrS family aminotransferase [bacterium]
MDKVAIPVVNPGRQVQALRAELLDAMARVMDGGTYIMGSEVERFERDFASFCGARHGVGVASGTDAVALALKAVGVNQGDEVITVSHSAVATVAAIEQIGAVPVFVDIDPVSRCLDPSGILPVLSARTRAIVPVHIYGQPAAMGDILAIARRRGLRVVEDCAQAHGAEIEGQRVGSFGDAAAFSFYPTKNLGAIGDGGMVVTSSDEVREALVCLRQYGWKERYISDVPGNNSRLDELQAAILSVHLRRLEADNARRRDIAGRYLEALEGTGLVGPARISGTLHAMHLFVVETADPERLRGHLAHAGVGTGRHYPMAIHQQPAYRGRIRGGDLLPRTEALYARILSLPMFPGLTDHEVEVVCQALRDWKEIN